MAGNVVTKEMTEELIFSGADVIKAPPFQEICLHIHRT